MLESPIESVKSATVEVEKAAIPQEDEYPDGGWQAWAAVLGGFLVQFATFGYISAFGVYQGWIGGIQLLFVFSSGIVTGRAFDRGYFHHMMIGGALLHTFSFFMLSLSQPNQYYQVFLSHGLGGGLATGIVYTPSITIPTHYFKRHRAGAMGIISSGAAVAAIIHPILLNRLFHSSVGFHNGVRISASMNALAFLIANALMKTRLPPKKVGPYLPVILEFARDPPYVIFVIAGMLLFFGIFLPQFFLQLDAVSHGVHKDFAFYCLSILNAASFFGRVIPAVMVPKVGPFNLLVFSTFSVSVILYLLCFVKTQTGFIVFSIFYGFFSGTGIALMPATVATLANDVSEIGARVGLRSALGGVVGLFATPVLGALLTSELHWWRPIIFSSTTMVGSSICYLICRMMVAQRKGTPIV